MVIVLVKFTLSELTSKPCGAIITIPTARLVPDTLKLVDEDAVPNVPLKAAKVPEVEIDGGDGFTVIVNVTGAPLQPVLAAIKFPLPIFPELKAMVFVTVLFVVLITEIEFASRSIT